MNRKRILIICSVCLAVAVLGTLAISYSSDLFPNDTSVTASTSEIATQRKLYPGEILSMQQEAEKAARMSTAATTTLPPSLEALKTCPYPELLEKSYALATPEQKAKLDKIDKFMGYGKYPRQIKTIMGILPEDTPYLTVEKATEALKKIPEGKSTGDTDWEYEVELLFNEIAGAPDYVGGSGIYRRVYFTDETHSQNIIIWFGSVDLYQLDAETGEYALKETLSK